MSSTNPRIVKIVSERRPHARPYYSSCIGWCRLIKHGRILGPIEISKGNWDFWYHQILRWRRKTGLSETVVFQRIMRLGLLALRRQYLKDLEENIRARARGKITKRISTNAHELEALEKELSSVYQECKRAIARSRASRGRLLSL